MERFIHEWPKQRDSSGVIIAVVGVVVICMIAFTIMSVGNYRGASYPLASIWWGENVINFTHWFGKVFTPALPG